jgi:hypothetical protein
MVYENPPSQVSTHMQDAYGVQVSFASTNDPYACLGAEFGNRVDSSTGLLLMGHRYYDPRLADSSIATRSATGAG